MEMTGADVHPLALQVVDVVVMNDRIILHEVSPTAIRIVRGIGRHMAAPSVASGVRPDNHAAVTIVVGLDVIDRDMTRPLVEVHTVGHTVVRHNAILGPTIGVTKESRSGQSQMPHALPRYGVPVPRALEAGIAPVKVYDAAAIRYHDGIGRRSLDVVDGQARVLAGRDAQCLSRVVDG